MTELSGNAVFLDPGAHRRGLAGDEHLLRAAGRPGPRGRGPDRRRRRPTSLPTGEVGEILVRAPQVMAGYWDDPDGHRRRPAGAGGCTPATSAGSTTTACCTSSTAARTSSSPAGRTCRPVRSRTCCSTAPGVVPRGRGRGARPHLGRERAAPSVVPSRRRLASTPTPSWPRPAPAWPGSRCPGTWSSSTPCR